MRKVLVALDESDASKRAATFVNEFFDASSTEVVAVNVAAHAVPWVAGVPFGAMWGWGWPTGDVAVLAAHPELDERRDLAAEAEEAVQDSGLRASEVVHETGNAAQAILRAADETGADLIVVGTNDQGALARFVFGSVSDDIVRQADRPVLVVR